MKKFPVVSDIALLSPAGKFSLENFPVKLFDNKHYLTFSESFNKWIGEIAVSFNNKYDRSINLALEVVKELKSYSNNSVLIGNTSRGTTELIEKYYSDFVVNSKLSPRVSPNTTISALSNILSEHLGLNNSPAFTLSATCSSGILSIITGIMFLNSGYEEVIIISSEAPITSFTMEQVKALRIYSNADESIAYPSTPLEFEKNSFVLGEGSAYVLLKNKELISGDIYISGYGYYRKTLGTLTSISEEAFEKSFLRATKGEIPDVIITHAPGTKQGDKAEFNVIKRLFPNSFITNIKWKIGHNYAVSGLANLFLGVAMLKFNKVLRVPYIKKFAGASAPEEIRSVLVSSAGFGGHAASLFVKKY